MRITYKDLRNKSYKELIKSGATDKQIQQKLSDFYLRENRQLIINEKDGLTLSKALKELKKGRVSQGVLLEKTIRFGVKNDIKNLKKLTKTLGKNSFAANLYNRFQRGEINVYQLNDSVFRYSNNPAKYESDFTGNSDIEIITAEERNNHWNDRKILQALRENDNPQSKRNLVKLISQPEEAWRSKKAVR